MSAEHARLAREVDVLEVIEEALENELHATDADWTDHLEMRLPDGALVSVEVKVSLP